MLIGLVAIVNANQNLYQQQHPKICKPLYGTAMTHAVYYVCPHHTLIDILSTIRRKHNEIGQLLLELGEEGTQERLQSAFDAPMRYDV